MDNPKGNANPGTQPTPPSNKMDDSKGKTSSGIQPNVAGLLCYVAWWVTGIVFLVIEKENKFVRFHAFQSIFAFIGITVVEIILSFIPFIWPLYWVIWVLAILLWLYCMYMAYQGKMFKLPVVGNIAEKQVNPTP
jgi:uncharacterized membrane protein